MCVCVRECVCVCRCSSVGIYQMKCGQSIKGINKKKYIKKVPVCACVCESVCVCVCRGGSESCAVNSKITPQACVCVSVSGGSTKVLKTLKQSKWK